MHEQTFRIQRGIKLHSLVFVKENLFEDMDWRRKQIKCNKSTDVNRVKKYNKINTNMCLMDVFFPLVWKRHVMEAK